ncbi:ABC transporter ATP-binding protein [candidate division WOR-3 bacterium]|nr:ABC transporter ATP-binding protein [candidate division WOR-3 bacterium]
MAEVVCENLLKVFGKKAIAVDNVSFKVKDGEFLTLLGPSGCGKTTILRLVAGLETPDSGNIFIDGKLVNDISPSKRDIAMVFQSYALYPHMNVFKNIGIPLKIRKLNKDKITEKVHSAVNLLGISDLLQRMPKELSGGQRQRVALGRAIVREPKVFLLDEPLSNLDALLREKTRGELKELFSRIGGTVVYVTHDQVEAMTMSDRVAVINQGKIQQIGTPLEIYNSPKNIFVANFVGSPRMNLISGKVEGEWFRAGKFSLKLPDTVVRKFTSPQDSSNSKKITIGIRPEDIYIDNSDSSCYPAIVNLVEPLGAQTLIFVKLEDISIRLISKSGVKVGEKINIRFDLDKMHFFDTQTSEMMDI